jgi:hypothetical protein
LQIQFLPYKKPTATTHPFADSIPAIQKAYCHYTSICRFNSCHTKSLLPLHIHLQIHFLPYKKYTVFIANTGCGKLTSFFEYEMPYEKGS